MGQDSIVLLICITVFLSYLPEAGQYSSFFLYLRQVRSYCTGLVMFSAVRTAFHFQGAGLICETNAYPSLLSSCQKHLGEESVYLASTSMLQSIIEGNQGRN